MKKQNKFLEMVIADRVRVISIFVAKCMTKLKDNLIPSRKLINPKLHFQDRNSRSWGMFQENDTNVSLSCQCCGSRRCNSVVWTEHLLLPKILPTWETVGNGHCHLLFRGSSRTAFLGSCLPSCRCHCFRRPLDCHWPSADPCSAPCRSNLIRATTIKLNKMNYENINLNVKRYRNRSSWSLERQTFRIWTHLHCQQPKRKQSRIHRNSSPKWPHDWHRQMANYPSNILNRSKWLHFEL